jgi:hypothetical protein
MSRDNNIPLHCICRWQNPGKKQWRQSPLWIIKNLRAISVQANIQNLSQQDENKKNSAKDQRWLNCSHGIFPCLSLGRAVFFPYEPVFPERIALGTNFSTNNYQI